MSAPTMALGIAACLLAALFGTCAAWAQANRMRSARRREAAYGTSAARRILPPPGDASQPLALRYAAALSRRLYAKTTSALLPNVRRGKAASTHAGAWFKEHAELAGCSKEISTAAYCEARARLGIAGGLAGALLGILLSNEMALLLGAVGFLLASTAPKRAIKSACRKRAACAQEHLSEMLEVVALGLRSGLTFDRSFALYGSHFDNAFAQSCAKAHRSWTLGIVTREDALRDLAASYDCEQLSRIIESAIRSLRFGSALTGILEEAAEQCRAEYRSALEERVAKAPVKMMLPTGMLILPAMLLLVMGPILLELAGGF